MPDDLARFAAKCRFDPITGCVIWTAATSAGRGNTARYGSFKYRGKRVSAHRWAAEHIHNLPIGGVTVGHCCPHGPNTLCVQHLRPETLAENVSERNTRVAQSRPEKQYWLLVGLGHKEPPPLGLDDPDATPATIPFYECPEWLKPYLPTPEPSDECPF